ncbi:MAG: PDR/VanB family oxidoreductase [Aeromicrobium sp.]
MTDTMHALFVRQMRLESDDVMSLELEAPDGSALHAWEPGAHLEVDLGDRGVRHYSLCGPRNAADTYTVAVLRTDTVMGGSDFVHRSLRPGDTLRTSSPRNHFSLDVARRYVLVAGGIGITPIMAMISELEATGADWTLHYGGKRRGSMAFVEALRAHGDRVTITSDDLEGPIDLDRALPPADEQDVLVYCCGPTGLIDAVEQRCADRPEIVRVERFAPKVFEDEPADHASFDVECAVSEVTVSVPDGTSIVDALEASGIGVDTSCRDGICGTCETKVLAGVPLHRDSVLSSAEQEANRTMMICVSRAISDRLVLDL